MGLTPCLYFGTRRCTFSDVVSIVTTVKPIPRLTAQHHNTSSNNDSNSHPGTNGQSSTSQSKQPSGSVSPAVVVWVDKALASSKDSPSHPREPERPFAYSVSEAFAYTNAPLEGDRDRKRRMNDKQALALSTEKAFFMSRLQEKRCERFTREQSAALAVQHTYRGFLLRKKFLDMKTKLKIRKRIRVNLAKVTKGTAIITGEKDRRARAMAARSEAASTIPLQFRRYCAHKCAAKERALRRFEQLDGHTKRIQHTWRACMAKACTRKLRMRLIEQRRRALAVLTARLFQGHQARQRVRRVRQHQKSLAAQRIQWAIQRVHAEKARRLQHRRRRDEQRHRAAIQIQKLARGCLYRARVTRMGIQEELSIRIACALSIQRVARGFLGRQSMRYQRAWRCVIHITRIVRAFVARRAVQVEKLLQETDLLIQTRRGNISTVIDLLDGYGAVDFLGNLQGVRLLLEYGADVMIADAQGRTAWRIALLQGHESCFLEIRRKWLDSVSSSSSSSSINSALLTAQGSSQELEGRDGSSEALVNSATRAAKRTEQLHPQLEVELVDACKAGNIEKARFLIEEFGVSVNSTDRADDGDSLLMLACQSANMALIRHLVQQESDSEDGELLDVHYVNSSGESALVHAMGTLTILDLLVSECKAAKPSHPFGAKRRSAAHEAVR